MGGIINKYCIESESLCLVNCVAAPWCENCSYVDNPGCYYPGTGEYCWYEYSDCIEINCGPLEPGCRYIPGISPT